MPCGPGAGGWLPKVREWFTESPAAPHELRRRQAAERERRLEAEVGPGPEPPIPPQGLYIYGSVGSGKTMLMDRSVCGSCLPEWTAACTAHDSTNLLNALDLSAISSLLDMSSWPTMDVKQVKAGVLEWTLRIAPSKP